MALLDRLRPQPGWKHPDPAIRLSALETLPATEQAVFATLAREDDTPRVRRAAVARLDDPETLGAIAKGDADDQVRAEAIARLTALAVAGIDPAIGRRAVAALVDERHLGIIARSAAPIEICGAALDRVTEPKAIGGVARHAEHEEVRLRALTRLNDRPEIEAVATHTEHKDVGLAALERLETLLDAAALDGIALRAKNKVVARRAKAIVKERTAADAEFRAAAEALARRRGQLTDALDLLEKTRDRVRGLNELQRLEEEWRALGAAPDDSQTRWHQGTERVRMHCDDLARQETADAERRAAVGEAVARRRALIEAAQAADGPEGGAPETLSERLDALRAEWAMLNPVDADELKGLDREFQQACGACESRAAARLKAAAVQERLGALATEAAQLAEAEPLDAARSRWGAVASEWRAATAGLPVDAIDPGAYGQYTTAAARWQERDHAAREASREASARAAAENLARLQDLAHRAASLVAVPEPAASAASAAGAAGAEGATAAEAGKAPDAVKAHDSGKELRVRDVERMVRDLRAAIDKPGPLPAGAAPELIEKLKAALEALSPKLQEARETDEWRRWANAGIQEELCKRMEALKESKDGADLPEVARQLRDLRRQWKAVSVAPKDDADALWNRFKSAGDEVQARVDTHLSAVLAEQNANLAKKLALCEKAEALMQSTDWIATAETLKGLQAEWNAIGPVPNQQGPKDQTPDVARRFRTACDTFFTRRKTDLVQRKSEWAQNQQKKETLCVRMEVLAESTEWAATFNEIKQLQAEWKTVGPVRRNKSEALWKRFRGACDKFFERYGKRHEIDLRSRVEEREAICRTLEALAPGAQAAAEAAVTAGASVAVASELPQTDTQADSSEPVTQADVMAAVEGVAPESQDAAPEAAVDAAVDAAPEVVAEASAEVAEAVEAAAEMPIEAAPVEPPSREEVVRAVEEAWRRWRQSPGLPSEVLVPVRARFESALTTVMTSHAAALQGTVFDLEQTKKRMKTLCDDVEGVTRGLPDAQLGSTSVSALATLLKEKLAANTIGGRVNEEAKTRAAADRVRRAQMTWRDLGPVPGTEGNQLEARFHRACRRFFEQNPQFDQPREGHREHRGGGGGDHREHRGGGGGGGGEHRGDRGDRGPRGPRRDQRPRTQG
jgi:hypothetical protein